MLIFPEGIQGGLRRFWGITPPAATTPLARLTLRRRPPASEHQEEGTS